MGWGQRWPERQPRPAVQELSDEQKTKILAVLNKGIEDSPLLTALRMRARCLRGRFYVERLWPTLEDKPETEVVGRMTPLVGPTVSFLLEVENQRGSWREIARGTAGKLIKTIAGDMKGTFHGLGILDKSIRKARQRELDRLEIVRKENLLFVYGETGTACTVQEVLFHAFNVPIDVIAEPREWYAYQRKPEIAEVSEDGTKVLVHFVAYNISYGEFSGTFLYAIVGGKWQAFTIKPNQSGSIEEALAWLEKRNWQGW